MNDFAVSLGGLVRSMRRSRGWRARLSMLAVLSLLSLVPVGLASQGPASASVTVTTFAGTGTAGFSGDGGAATSAQLNQPRGLAADNAGNVYIFDSGNQRIRKVSPGGKISTMSGDGSACSTTYLGDEWSLDVSGICPSSLPVGFGGGPGGVVYINNGGWLDEVYAGMKVHVAGDVTGSNYNPGDGTDFGVNVSPSSLAVGIEGVYFSEPSTTGWPGNSIKLWAQGGGVSTVAGMPGTSVCNYFPSGGQAALGACIHPQYLTQWSHYLYFFDDSPGWQGPEIFRLDLSQSPMYLTQIAGNGSWSDSGGNGSLAVDDGIGQVGPIAIDSNGNLFFGNVNDGSIREVDTSGKLWNVTDIGAPQDSYAFDASNHLYVSEPGSNKVVKVSGLDRVASKGNLVAIGDSVPAGEGINYGFVWDPVTSGWVRTGPKNPAWSNTTRSLGANFQDCHQSDYAYPRYFSGSYNVYDMACTSASALQEPGTPGGKNAYTAGGVMVFELFGDATTMPAELGSSSIPRCTGCDAANPLFDANLGSSGVVLLQLGADDIDFGDWMLRCYSTYKCFSSDQGALNTMLAREAADLRTTISELNNRAAEDGYGPSRKLRVVVTDYYNPYGSTWSSSCIDTGNGGLLGPSPGITSGQQKFIVKGLTLLDTNIYDEVQYAQANDSNLNISLVDLAGLFPGGRDIMAGHTFCTADPWVYGPSIDYPDGTHWLGRKNPAPLHPTPEGQAAIYQAVKQQAGL